MSELLTDVSESRARLTLNRPEALHALNTAMCAAMIEALLAWRSDERIGAVLIDHTPGTRGFCAGGDIRMLAESGARATARRRASSSSPSIGSTICCSLTQSRSSL